MIPKYNVSEAEGLFLRILSDDAEQPFVSCFTVYKTFFSGSYKEIPPDTIQEFYQASFVGGLSYHDEGHLIFCVVSDKTVDKKIVARIMMGSIREALKENGIGCFVAEHPGLYTNRRQICPISFYENEETGKFSFVCSLNVKGDLDSHKKLDNLCGVSMLEPISVESIGGNTDMGYWNQLITTNILYKLNSIYPNKFIGKEI